MLDVRRRDLITLLGGAAVTWPLAARAQQPKMLRLGFVGIQPRDAPIYRNFLRHMAEFGYQEGRNLGPFDGAVFCRPPRDQIEDGS
jgi:hypothetical protein